MYSSDVLSKRVFKDRIPEIDCWFRKFDSRSLSEGVDKTIGMLKSRKVGSAQWPRRRGFTRAKIGYSKERELFTGSGWVANLTYRLVKSGYLDSRKRTMRSQEVFYRALWGEIDDLNKVAAIELGKCYRTPEGLLGAVARKERRSCRSWARINR